MNEATEDTGYWGWPDNDTKDSCLCQTVGCPCMIWIPSIDTSNIIPTSKTLGKHLIRDGTISTWNGTQLYGTSETEFWFDVAKELNGKEDINTSTPSPRKSAKRSATQIDLSLEPDNPPVWSVSDTVFTSGPFGGEPSCEVPPPPLDQLKEVLSLSGNPSQRVWHMKTTSPYLKFRNCFRNLNNK